MKTTIDIITGFLGSGKTTLINRLLEEAGLAGKKVLILQTEEGIISINHNVPVFQFMGDNPLTSSKLLALLQEHKPHHIFLEYNGLMDVQACLDLLEHKDLRPHITPGHIFTTVNRDTFPTYSQNLGNLFLNPIMQADLILLTGTVPKQQEHNQGMIRAIKKINSKAQLESSHELSSGESILRPGRKQLPRLDKLLAYFLFWGGLVFLLRLLLPTSPDGIPTSLQAFITIFISIILQAIPFILIGVLVSALIQVFVSQELITSLFKKNTPLSMIIAMFAGVFFPICDCAIIPVMSRLIKKGIPIPAAVTFLLAAPIVDPVVIASTFYAFPGTPLFAISRLILGLTIALITGLLFLFSPPKQNILKDDALIMGCSCGYCNTPSGTEERKDFLARAKGVFAHAGGEFFHVGQFFVVAAFFSSLIQVYLPQNILAFFTANPLGALLTMMAFAFILSICSTSDAFIARNFYGQFSRAPVIGFMVFGAMMDIKNLFLLLGHFERGFVLRLILSIVTVAFAILALSTLIL